MGDCDNSLTTMDWLSAVDMKIAPVKNEFLESSLSLTSPPSSSKDPFEDFRPIERETGKPSHSYSTLIKFAISSTRSKRMSLRQIYKWISDNFPYYKDARNGWKNSIRHNLSLNKCFIKVPRDQGDMGKGCYWSLREASLPPEKTLGGPNSGMQTPIVTVTSSSVSEIPQQQHELITSQGINSSLGDFVCQISRPQPPVSSAVAQPSLHGPDSVPELSDSAVGALAALIGSQSDQVLGAAFAPAVAAASQEPSHLPPASSTMMRHQSLHGQSDPAQCLTPQPPPPLSPPSMPVADQLSLSASLQTICRSLLGESSSGGSSGLGAFASVEAGGSGCGRVGAGGLGSSGTVCQAPDLSASTIDFVQRMLPQLKDSFQLSDSTFNDLWDHCRSTSRPTNATAESAAGGAIPLPMSSVEPRRYQQPPSARQPLPPPPPPPRWGHPQPSAQQQPPVHRSAIDASQEVEDDFNWDSIL